jgi:hypothetical protein
MERWLALFADRRKQEARNWKVLFGWVDLEYRSAQEDGLSRIRRIYQSARTLSSLLGWFGFVVHLL